MGQPGFFEMASNPTLPTSIKAVHGILSAAKHHFDLACWGRIAYQSTRSFLRRSMLWHSKHFRLRAR